jgi:hypothetical protein
MSVSRGLALPLQGRLEVCQRITTHTHAVDAAAYGGTAAGREETAFWCAVCTNPIVLQGIVYLGNSGHKAACGTSAWTFCTPLAGCCQRCISVWFTVVKRDCIHLKISQHWFYKTLTKLKEFCWRASLPDQVLAPLTSASTARQLLMPLLYSSCACCAGNGLLDQILAPLHAQLPAHLGTLLMLLSSRPVPLVRRCGGQPLPTRFWHPLTFSWRSAIIPPARC